MKHIDEKYVFFDKILNKNTILMILDSTYSIVYASSNVSEHIGFSAETLTHKKIYDIVDTFDHRIIPTPEILKNEELIEIDNIQICSIDKTLISFNAILKKHYENSDNNYYIWLFLNNNFYSKDYPFDTLKLLIKIIDNSEQAISILSEEGFVIFSNYTFIRLYGLSKNELKSIPFYEFDAEITNKGKWEYLKEYLKQNSPKTEEVAFTTTAGINIIIERHWMNYVLNNKEYYLLTMIPIKERKEMEQKMFRTLERQHILSQIAFILNTHENFEYKVNESLRIMGNFLKIDRILIFQNILNNKATSCSFEWHSNDQNPCRFELQAIPYSLLPIISKNLNEFNYKAFDGLSVIPSEILPYFPSKEIHSLIILPLKLEKQSQQGFICFIDHKKRHYWKDSDQRFIITFSEILSGAFRVKHNVDALIKSERRFRELAELLPEMVCEAGINGKLTFANKHLQVQFGFTENDLTKGIIFFNFFHPEDKQRVLENFEKLLTGINITNEEYRIINREKQEIPVLLHMNIIMHDQLPAGLRAILVDISERKAREHHLEKLAYLAENSPIAILESDEDGNLEFINERAMLISNTLKDFLPNIIQRIKLVISQKNRIEYSFLHEDKEYKCSLFYNEKSRKVSIFIPIF